MAVDLDGFGKREEEGGAVGGLEGLLLLSPYVMLVGMAGWLCSLEMQRSGEDAGVSLGEKGCVRLFSWPRLRAPDLVFFWGVAFAAMEVRREGRGVMGGE